ncbi:hypothetical protein POM88_011784 [Heracleum sosnowskyi]|uniref:F-box associated beta-propeller type 3 domain-containing protein n=1 Tax=Heracleum sosnowskyi TaxID=360622 RepID=A0AAD8IXF6_9APIA|nr:hypothetical protein POM88_011784 [Heracleum sosnowskyi]
MLRLNLLHHSGAAIACFTSTFQNPCWSVCKSWKSKISNLQFIQGHIDISNKKPASILKLFLPNGGDNMARITRENFAKLNLPTHGNTMYRFMRSCNGLVCLANAYGNLIQLWNPTTRQSKQILAPEKHSRYHELNLGFGFDSISNDYKILMIVRSKLSTDGHFTSVLEGKLYSSNADSWKEIHVPQSFMSCPIAESVLSINGVLYFEGTHGIVSLDLHNEVFGYLLPNSVQHERKLHVLEFEGSVAMVFVSVSEEPVLSLWTLDDVCGNVSWIKKFNLEADLRIDRLVLYLGVGQFVAFNSDIGYIFYDYKKKETRQFPLPTRAREAMLIVKYIESLVSLEGFEQLE